MSVARIDWKDGDSAELDSGGVWHASDTSWNGIFNGLFGETRFPSGPSSGIGGVGNRAVAVQEAFGGQLTWLAPENSENLEVVY